MPTILHLGPDGTARGGLAAAGLARSDRRHIAERFVERLGDPTPILVGGVGYSASALVARYLSWLVETVTTARGTAPDLVLVVVPGSWPHRRREGLADALARVEADVALAVRTAAEASAALFNRAGRATPGSYVGTFDLGTGWFEAAVHAAMPAGFVVAGGPVGLSDATTSMLDELLRTHVLAAAARLAAAAPPPDAAVPSSVAGPDTEDGTTDGTAAETASPAAPVSTPPLASTTPPVSASASGPLLTACAAAREELVIQESTRIEVSAADSGTGDAISVPVTRDEYEALVRPMIEDAVRALARAIRSVPATPEDLSLLVMRGPGARLPLVGRLLDESLGGIGRRGIEADSDLALGAALLAATESPAEPAGSQTVVLGPAAYVTTPPPSIPPVSRPPAVSSPVDVPPGAVAGGLADPGGEPVAPVTALTALTERATAAGHQPPAGATGPAAGGPVAGGPVAGGPVAGGPVAGGPVAGRSGSRPRPGTRPVGPFGSMRRLLAAAAALVVFVTGSVTLGLVLTDDGSDPAAITAADTGPLPPSTIDQHPQFPADSMRSAEQAAGIGADDATATRTTVPAGPNTVIATGSAEVAPITGTAYAMFREAQKGVTVQVSATDTDDGLTKLCAGQADIAGASFALTDPACKDKVVGFEIAHHLLPIVVSKANTWAQCLTTAQIGSLWKRDSTVTSWNQIDPSFPAEPVRLVGPAPSTVHAKVFLASMTGASDNTRQYQEVELDEVPAEIEYARGAIGFMDYSNFQAAADEVRAVQIDAGRGCVEPNAVTAGTGMYMPLCKPLYIYASKEALRRPAVAAFMKYYMENQRDVTNRAHFVARDDATIRDNTTIVNAMTAGVGPVQT
ncbi:Hsp70 family protein [Frankia sp. Cpl3]|uniref:substrate-binding domain-containing protein n=1 Tax=Parafrankia colletiae TaxID=573497 RepID=UPI001F51DEC4|nr:substrate-binding domain-containing protein [Parafrankia colletiae]MCK9901736.1 Hsp70 family protein [Frankia sp. Cpl3]